jgi:hypothetical protein
MIFILTRRLGAEMYQIPYLFIVSWYLSFPADDKYTLPIAHTVPIRMSITV